MSLSPMPTAGRQSASLPSMTELLEQRARADATMWIHDGDPVPFSRMLAESQSLATTLREAGVGVGDRVAVWLPTTPAWLATWFACARLGAIAVAVNTRYVARELTDIVGRSGARVLVYWPGFARIDFAAILSQCREADLPALEHLIAVEAPDDAPRSIDTRWPSTRYRDAMQRPPMTEVVGTVDSPCIIWTTSGTTKAPKFVLHAQRSVVGHAFDVVVAHGLDEQAVSLLAPPICGAFGAAIAMAMCAAGRPLITSPVWEPAQSARAVLEHRVTHLHAVDDAFAQLLDCVDGTPAFPSLRFGGYGAFNPAQKEIVERADQRGLKLVGMYGTSEIQGLGSRQSENASLADRALAGGWPTSPLARVRARDPISGQLLPHGQDGELEVFAPTSRMLGYFGDEAATAAAFTDDGYYRTGDLGHTLPDGRFVFLGRVGDTMRLGGFLVSPAEIESLIEEWPGVEVCQVVDVPYEGKQRPVAFVVMQGGQALDPQAVIADCRARLAHYKVPVAVISIDELPVTEGTNGKKVQKSRLRTMAVESLAGGGPLSGAAVGGR